VTLTDKQRLDRIEQRNERIERAIAQIASALRVASGWRPEPSGQAELAEILAEQQDAIARERHETREVVTT
jgi:phytoene dehydrogenase-like protein